METQHDLFPTELEAAQATCVAPPPSPVDDDDIPYSHEEETYPTPEEELAEAEAAYWGRTDAQDVEDLVAEDLYYARRP